MKRLNKIILQSDSFECGKGRNVIVGCRFICDPLAAFLALVDDHPTLFTIVIQPYGFHLALADRFPIPRAIFIDMQTPHTCGAMVPVAAILEWFHIFSTMCARKPFLACDEYHVARR